MNRARCHLVSHYLIFQAPFPTRDVVADLARGGFLHRDKNRPT